MTFIEALIASGYVFDNEDYDGCYVKQDSEGFIHCYQENVEDETDKEWNYVKMTEDFDVLIETTVIVDDNCLPNSAQ
jgi:hypothetical protein